MAELWHKIILSSTRSVITRSRDLSCGLVCTFLRRLQSPRYDLRGRLLNDSPTLVAYVQPFPAAHRLHFVAVLVTREKPGGNGRVTAWTHPRIYIPSLVLNVFFDHHK